MELQVELPRNNVAQILRGVAYKSGDGFKDDTFVGDVVYVYAGELPAPHEPGQYLRVGQTRWTASDKMFRFSPATLSEIAELFASLGGLRAELISMRGVVAERSEEIDRLKEVVLDYNQVLRSAHNVVERIAVEHGTVELGTNFGGLHSAVKTTLEKHHNTLVPYFQEQTQKYLD